MNEDDEIIKLRAEVEKLRAALREIAEGGVSDHPPTLWAFARAVLSASQPAPSQKEGE